MTFIKRMALAWRMTKIMPSMDFWQGALPKLETLQWQIPQKLEALDAFLPKLDALERVITNLEMMESRMPQVDVMDELSKKLETLDSVVTKIESLSLRPQAPVPAPVVKQPIDMTAQHEWNRLKMLAKFCQLEGKAKEIEAEWQKIQQDTNDAQFAFQVVSHGNNELQYVYKRGISEGIKWCVDRFC